MIVKTRAVVLRSKNLRETSKFLTLYTEGYGKLTVVAKGVRQPKSRFAGVLEPFNIISVVLYKKESRDVHYISSAEIIEPTWRLTAHFDSLATAFAVAELIDTTMQGEEGNPALFGLLTETLRSLGLRTQSPAVIFLSFQIRLIAFLGYGLDIRTCAQCSKHLEKEQHIYLDAAGGGALCTACAGALNAGTKLSSLAYDFLNFMITSPENIAEQTTIPSSECMELHRVLNSYIVQHSESTHRLRASALMNASATQYTTRA